MLHTIFIQGLRCRCIIGIHDWERQTPQTLNLDIEVQCAQTPQADEKEHLIIDYQGLAELVQTIALDGQFKLLETLAQAIIHAVMKRYPPCERCKLMVQKKGRLPHTDACGVTLEQHRNDD